MPGKLLFGGRSGRFGSGTCAFPGLPLALGPSVNGDVAELVSLRPVEDPPVDIAEDVLGSVPVDMRARISCMTASVP